MTSLLPLFIFSCMMTYSLYLDINCVAAFFLFFQANIDLLLVGDVTGQYLADTVQKLFSNIAKVTVIISYVKRAAALVDDCTFDMVFLKLTSSPTAEELEVVKLIR